LSIGWNGLARFFVGNAVAVDVLIVPCPFFMLCISCIANSNLAKNQATVLRKVPKI
jgi:hypothetical protein